MSQRTMWRARRFYHLLVWSLIWVSGWDALGLLGAGDAFYTGPSYDVLRSLVSQVGGMRAYGVPLGLVCAVLAIMTTWSYGRHSAGRATGTAPGRHSGLSSGRLFPVCLSALATWYSVWTVGVATANVSEFIQHGTFLSWGSVSKLVFVTVVAIGLACLPPPPPAPYGMRSDPAGDGGNGGTDFSSR